MSLNKLALFKITAVFLLVASCSKQVPNQSDTFGRPVKTYDVSTFAKFSSFQGKILEKYVDFPEVSSGQTNYHIVVVLKKSNGEQLAVTQIHASQDMADIVNSLEKDRSYTFPNALTNGI